MTDEELKELHFENAVEKMLLSNTALLHTILANQKLIMKALNVADEATIERHVNATLANNVHGVESELRNKASKKEEKTKYTKN